MDTESSLTQVQADKEIQDVLTFMLEIREVRLTLMIISKLS